MMRLAVFLIGCVALSAAQLQFYPFPYAHPAVQAVTQSPIPSTTPIHHRNPAAEQQLAATVLAHEHNNRALQQQQLAQLASITGVAPGVGAAPVAPVAAAVPQVYPQILYPGYPYLG